MDDSQRLHLYLRFPLLLNIGELDNFYSKEGWWNSSYNLISLIWRKEDETVLTVWALCTTDFWSVGKCLVFCLSQGHLCAVCRLLMEPPLVLVRLWFLNLATLKQVWLKRNTVLNSAFPYNRVLFVKGGGIARSWAGNWGIERWMSSATLIRFTVSRKQMCK